MMLSIKDTSAPEDFERLKRVLLKCRDGKMVAFLKRYILTREETYKEMTIKETILEGRFLITVVDIDDGLVYLDITCKKRSDVNVIKNLWETSLKRGQQNFLEHKVNDYYLILDIISEELEQNTVYVLSFIQPMFISYEGAVNGGHDYKMCFKMQNVHFDIEHVTPHDVEYEEELQKQTQNGGYGYEEELSENEEPEEEKIPQTEQETGMEEFISGNQFLDT